jgi:hypothetical protein
MPTARPAIRATALCVLAGLMVGGCSGLEFTQDRRLHFTSPQSDALTHLPVTLSWTMKDLRTTGADADRFAVFVDQHPIKVGHNVDSVLPKGTRPTRALLAEANVYVTSADHVELKIVPDLDDVRASRQRHTATVVLLDASGDRINESSWSRQFDLPRSGE